MNETKKIEIKIECPACNGTGVYVGMAERNGAAVICHKCDGTGKYNFSFSYKDFTGRKIRDDVKRVYLSGYGYCIAPVKINFKGVGEIDMSAEGVSYDDFLDGKKPSHIEQLVCPMRADQSACHGINSFIDECERLNGGWISYIPGCRMQDKKHKCWKRFKEATNDRK